MSSTKREVKGVGPFNEQTGTVYVNAVKSQMMEAENAVRNLIVQCSFSWPVTLSCPARRHTKHT